MRVSKPTAEKAKGVFAAFAKRGLWFVLGILVLQLLTLQMSVDNGSAHQREQEAKQQLEAQRRFSQAIEALKKTQAKSDAHTDEQNRQTQEYVRCLFKVVLLPPYQRPSDIDTALNTCDKPTSKGSTISTGGASATVPHASSTSTTNQPTTSAPPDPSDRGNQPAQPQGNPLVDVRPLLKGAYQTAKSVPVVGGLIP